MDGGEVNLRSGLGFFLTMTSGYLDSARNELPDSLKLFFRPVAMAALDAAKIAEVVLYTHGFEHAAELAVRIVLVGRLADE